MKKEEIHHCACCLKAKQTNANRNRKAYRRKSQRYERELLEKFDMRTIEDESPACLYFWVNELTGVAKIGKSNGIYSRIKEHKNACNQNGGKFRLISVIKVKDNSEEEKKLIDFVKNNFAMFENKREYFYLDNKENLILDYFELIKQESKEFDLSDFDQIRIAIETRKKIPW